MASATDNPFDALVFEMKELQIKKSRETEPLGIFVKSVMAGGQPYICRVLEGSPASAAGIKVGDYVLSINGHRVDTKSQMAAEVSRAGVAIQVMAARRRDTPIDPCSLGQPGSTERRPGFIYHVCRLDPIRRKNLGISVAMVDNRVTVDDVTTDGSAFWSGLQPRDGLLTIGQEPVQDVKQCQALLKANEGKLFDVLIERPLDAIGASVAFNEPSFQLQKLSFVRGVAAAGVPEAPPELKTMLKNRAELIMQNIRKGCKTKPKPKGKAVPAVADGPKDSAGTTTPPPVAPPPSAVANVPPSTKAPGAEPNVNEKKDGA